ncbi:MAG: heme-binding protein, partial [Rhodospirillaceae bacterium]|nr:heme-binding protein [Rhodospirillaceae bacterium]
MHIDILQYTTNSFGENEMNILKTILLAAAVAIFGLASTAAGALEMKPILTLDMAKKMADACEAARAKGGWRPLNIAIFDDGGNIKLFRRQENAFLGSIQIATMKGHTSAMFPFPTRLVESLAFEEKDGKPPALPGIAFVPGIISFAGGVPIMTAAGQQIGAIGVSG